MHCVSRPRPSLSRSRCCTSSPGARGLAAVALSMIAAASARPSMVVLFY